MGQHLFLNIIPIVFTAGSRRKLWCDRSMRGWSQQPLLAPSVNIFGYNSVKSGGPTSISQHNPQQFDGWNWTEMLVWMGHGTLTGTNLPNIKATPNLNKWMRSAIIIKGLFASWTMKSSQGLVKYEIGYRTHPGTTLVYTKEKNVKVTMEFEAPKRHILRPTLSTDMVQRVLRWERQKRSSSTKRQGSMTEKCCYNKILMIFFWEQEKMKTKIE